MSVVFSGRRRIKDAEIIFEWVITKMNFETKQKKKKTKQKKSNETKEKNKILCMRESHWIKYLNEV